jgi:hypothetical protein
MSSLHIAEFNRLGQVNYGNIPVPAFPLASEQVVDISAASLQNSVPLTAAPFVCLTAEEDCRIEIGTNPTADANSMPMAQGEKFWCSIPAGYKVAVIVRAS